jgi:hypothetical protein
MAEESDINSPPPEAPGLWSEPEGPTVDNPPLYPYNQVTQTESGHSFEMDDTPGAERIRLQHRTGSFMEFNARGDNTIKILGNGFEIIAGNKNVEVTGHCNLTVKGDCNLDVTGDFNHQVLGDYNLYVKGEYNLRADGDMWFQGNEDVYIIANPLIGGAVTIFASDTLTIDAGVKVKGPIKCDTLDAESRINAGMGVNAGPFGFTSELGGLSLGFPSPAAPLAIAGSITCVGTIFAKLPITTLATVNALQAVNSPLGNFPVATKTGLMKATWMTDSVNKGNYNAHIHPVLSKDYGITGTPTIPMI